MNTIPRRKDRTLDPQEAEKIFDAVEYGYLTLVSDDEYPYSIPVNFAKVGKSAYIHCAPEGRKLDMISRNPHACLSAVSRADVVPEKFTLSYASAMAFGKIYICRDDSERLFGLRANAKKFCPHLEDKAESYIQKSFGRTFVLRFDFEGISGKCKNVQPTVEKKGQD